MLGYGAPAGDFNGDGAIDFVCRNERVVPDPANDSAWSRAYLIYGTSNGQEPLRLDRLEPPFGPIKGGSKVDVWGTGFTAETRVFFGKSVATLVELNSSNRLRVKMPPAEFPGFVDVVVSNGVVSKRLDSGFEYTPNFPEIDLAHLGPSGTILQGKLHDALGFSVAIGDVTGDGIDDVIAGKLPETDGGAIAGIMKGDRHLPESLPAFDPAGMATIILASLDGNGSTPQVSFLGDVNGDSIGDLAITQHDSPGFIVFGGRDLPGQVNLDAMIDAGAGVKIVPGSALPGEWTMIPAGDLTGDGIVDLALSFGQGTLGTDQVAGAVLFIRGRTDWPHVITLGNAGEDFARIIGSTPGQEFGFKLEAVGDVNGDGFPDLLAMTNPPDNIFNDPYKYLIYGSDHLLELNDIESLIRDGGGVRILTPLPLGRLTGAGDVNGDHYADILIGQQNGGGDSRGITYLIYGGPSLPQDLDLEEKPAQPDGVTRILGDGAYRFAGNVSGAGDFNHDGFADFLIGEIGSGDANGHLGGIAVILGSKLMPPMIDLGKIGSQGFWIHGRNAPAVMGDEVGPFGDLNGDGQPDFVFGERSSFVNGQPAADESRLYIIFGPYGDKEFIRGDANRDGLIDISDAVTILTYLFLGGEKPLCIDALDTDDSGLLDITDAIYLLSFLYTGGPAPRDPFPGPGRDPTQDVQNCLGFNP